MDGCVPSLGGFSSSSARFFGGQSLFLLRHTLVAPVEATKAQPHLNFPRSLSFLFLFPSSRFAFSIASTICISFPSIVDELAICYINLNISNIFLTTKWPLLALHVLSYPLSHSALSLCRHPLNLIISYNNGLPKQIHICYRNII